MSKTDSSNEVQATEVELQRCIVDFRLPARCWLWPEEAVQAMVDTTAGLFGDYVAQVFERESPLGTSAFSEVVKVVAADDPTSLLYRSLVIIDLPAPLVPEFFDRVLPQDEEEEMWAAFEDGLIFEARNAAAKIRSDIAAGAYAR